MCVFQYVAPAVVPSHPLPLFGNCAIQLPPPPYQPCPCQVVLPDKHHEFVTTIFLLLLSGLGAAVFGAGRAIILGICIARLKVRVRGMLFGSLMSQGGWCATWWSVVDGPRCLLGSAHPNHNPPDVNVKRLKKKRTSIRLLKHYQESRRYTKP
jgi:hypothetical protein